MEQQKSVVSGAKKAPAATDEKPCPMLTLTAGRPGHLRALLAIIDELPEQERPGARLTLREFELWEEAHRCGNK